MTKTLLGAGLCILLLFLVFESQAVAQTTVANGDYELAELGPWTLTGDNGNELVGYYDTNGNGSLNLCWRRKPGLNAGQPFGNGGCAQDVYLISGVTYLFEANLAFAANC